MAKIDSRNRQWKQAKYPYKIPKHKDFDEKAIKKISQWRKLEFLRIEALLRAEKVHEIFKIKGEKEKNKALFKEYGLLWSILKGDHHKFLDPNNKELDFSEPSFIIDPVVDVNDYLRERSADGTKNLLKTWENMMVTEELGNRMLFQINTSFPPGKIIDILTPLLKVAYKKSKTGPISPYHISIKIIDGDVIEGKIANYALPKGITTRSITTYLKYFEYYDLFQSENRSYGFTAKKISPNIDKSNSIATDILRARIMIKEAEKWFWPPSPSIGKGHYPPNFLI